MPERIVVDLNRCPGYAQCVFLAPDVFALNGEEALMYDPNPDDAKRLHVPRAARARGANGSGGPGNARPVGICITSPNRCGPGACRLTDPAARARPHTSRTPTASVLPRWRPGKVSVSRGESANRCVPPGARGGAR